VHYRDHFAMKILRDGIRPSKKGKESGWEYSHPIA
jgi:hypothetical protein